MATAYGRKDMALLLILHCISLLLFVNGFLLSRIHLKERSAVSSTPVSPSAVPCERPYSKLVWIIIDALRYDFLVQDGRYACGKNSFCHQGRMPRLAKLLEEADGASIAYRYIADPPTTTTQRLKAMVSGGLPTFFDVSNAFTARPMDEDNLIDQLAAAGKRLTFVGDATWHNLFPVQFNPSRPYPCFNVNDLDTVDDGIWEHLLPTLRNFSAWDAFVVHYLGVDHAGHSVGVKSDRMEKKLLQMDTQIAAVINFMISKAGKNGAFEDTLLVISGDHGQTLNGDHGGGSPEEVDTVLMAVDIQKLHAQLEHSTDDELSDTSFNSLWASSCRKTCTCGEDGNQCVEDLPQIDLVPTLSVLLGVPIPFVNLGKLSPELWSLAANRCSPNNSKDAYKKALENATAANVYQVHKYLKTYSSHPASRFPYEAMQKLESVYATFGLESANDVPVNDIGMKNNHLLYLEEATRLARTAWTQFRYRDMIGGIVVFIVSLLYHFTQIYRRIDLSSLVSSLSIRQIVLMTTLWCASMVQVFGIFSFYYLLSEGKAITALVAACGVCLTLICLSSPQRWKIIWLGNTVLICAAISSVTGLLTHSGFGFWQRLTVHGAEDQTVSTLGAMVYSNIADRYSKEIQPEITFGSRLLFFNILPLGILLQLGASRSSRSNIINLYLSTALVLTAVYKSIDLAIKEDWISEDASIRSFLHSSEGLQSAVTSFAMKMQQQPVQFLWTTPVFTLSQTIAELPLRILLPRCIFAIIIGIILVSAVCFRSEIRSILFSCLFINILLVSPVLTPLLSLALFLEICSVISLAKVAAFHVDPDGGIFCITVAPILATLQSQVFFATGHLCEFAGLQYTSGFVGFREFHLLRAAILMSMDTFGAMGLVGSFGIRYAMENSTISGQHKVSKTTSSCACSEKRNDQLRTQSSTKQILVLLFAFIRAASCFCAMLSAAIQRRHLYVWALFAPRFVFETAFLLVTDLVLLIFS